MLGVGTITFFLLFQRGGPLSAVPAILAGGAAIMAIVGVACLGEPASWQRIAGVVLSIAALGAAVPLGLITGSERWWDRRLSPFIYLLYPIPHVVLLPLVILLFGIGNLSKIVLIGLIVFFQILVTTRDAARAIHPNYLLTMRTLGASRAQIYRHVIWPATLPRILTALRISIGTAVAILFFVESFATTRGLGFVIMDAWGQADYERLYAGIVAMAALGLCLYLLLDLVEERVCRWTRTA